MASKQILSLFRKNTNLCEISTEYPSLIRSLTPRHLCTCVKLKMSETIHIDKLSNKKLAQDHDQNGKDSKEHSKTIREPTELIKLFQYKQEEEEINDKLYKKCRCRLRRIMGNDDDEEKDNTN